MWLGYRQASIHFAQYLFENSALLLHAFGSPEQDGHDLSMCHGDAFRSMGQVALMGSYCHPRSWPWCLAAVEGKNRNGVVAALECRIQHVPRV